VAAATGGKGGSGGTAGNGGVGGGSGSGGSGGSAGSGGSDAGTNCFVSFTDSTCDGCFRQSCCALGQTCGASADCAALAQCLTACSDATCMQSCGTSHPNGVADWNAIVDCIDTSCAQPCGAGGSGGSGGSGGGGGSGGSGGAGGAGGSAGSGGSTQAPQVHCDYSFSTNVDAAYCQCTSTAGTGTPTYTGHPCGEYPPGSTGELCCAGGGFPNGGSCQCYQTGPWHCHGVTSQSCYCAYDTVTANLTTICNNVPGSDGHPWYCCADKASGSCDCNEDVPCTAGFVQVSDCSNPAKLNINKPPTSCPSGTAVSTCSQNLTGTCVSDSDCGGGCTGSNPVCCPSCNGSTHHCQMCCSTSNDTQCF
jgi:hypothetical protein